MVPQAVAFRCPTKYHEYFVFFFVGSVNDAEDGTDAGALYVYEKDINGIWSNEQKLKPSDGSQENYFGYQIEVFENTLVVSACGDVNNDPESGSVYVYEKGSNGTWGAEQKLTSFDAFKESMNFFQNSKNLYKSSIITMQYF